MSKQEERLAAWMNAGLPDDEDEMAEFGITQRDVAELQRRVFKAVHAKLFARPGKISVAQHLTVQ